MDIMELLDRIERVASVHTTFHAWFYFAHFLEIDCNAELLLDTFWKSCFSNYERSETSHYYDFLCSTVIRIITQDVVHLPSPITLRSILNGICRVQ